MVTTSRGLYGLCLLGILVFGAANTIIMKKLTLVSIDGEFFTHPLFMTAVMFMGESLCMLAYCVLRKPKQDLLLPPEKPRRTIFFAIPALLDLCASGLMFFGLVLTAPSVYQMIRGGVIVVVAVYSVVFLKKRPTRTQWVGVALTFLGVASIGLVSVLYKATSATNPLLGIPLLLLGQFFAGGMFVTEEYLLRSIPTPPLLIVGIEGLTGTAVFIVLLPIMNLIPCNNSEMCVAGVVENTLQALSQCSDWRVPVLLIGTMLSIAGFNFAGVTTTKLASALTRSVVDSARMVLVWIVSIALGWEVFLWAELAGFLLLIVGTLIYNQVLFGERSNLN